MPVLFLCAVAIFSLVQAELGLPPGVFPTPGFDGIIRSTFVGPCDPTFVCFCTFFESSCPHRCPGLKYQGTGEGCLLPGCPCEEGVAKIKLGRCPRYRPYTYIHRQDLLCDNDEDCAGTDKCCQVGTDTRKQCLRSIPERPRG